MSLDPLPAPLRLCECLTADDVSAFLRPVFQELAHQGLRVTSGWDHGIYSAYFNIKPHLAVPVIAWFATVTPVLNEPGAETAVTCLAGREVVSRRKLEIAGKPLPSCTQHELMHDLSALLRAIAAELDEQGAPDSPLGTVTVVFGLRPPVGASVH